MRPYGIPFLTLAISATVAVPLITAGSADASSRHLRKQHPQTSGGWNASARRSWAVQEIRPAAPAWSGDGNVCPGSGRSFECKIWPPPFDQDPDRKASGSDAGG
jgi:hypothetical protein